MNSMKELQNKLEELYGKELRLTSKIENLFLKEPAIFHETFTLKKVSVGQLEKHLDIAALLIACEFNKVRSISNIIHMEYIEDQKIILNTTEEGKPSQIEVTIEKI